MTSRPLGPARENDVSVELRGLEPVPGAERYGRPFRIFTMWLSPQFTPSALFIGVLAASLGLSFWQGLPAIVIGNIIGALVVAALCTWGPRTGMGQMPGHGGGPGRVLEAGNGQISAPSAWQPWPAVPAAIPDVPRGGGRPAAAGARQRGIST